MMTLWFSLLYFPHTVLAPVMPEKLAAQVPPLLGVPTFPCTVMRYDVIAAPPSLVGTLQVMVDWVSSPVVADTVAGALAVVAGIAVPVVAGEVPAWLVAVTLKE